MTHIIRQQYLHVELNGTESDGMALQSRLSDLCHQWLIPAVERVLDRCAPSNEHLIIERLDIDAGSLTLERFEHDIAALVEQALDQSLRTQFPPTKTTPAQGAGVAVLKTGQQATFDAFIYFLKTGSLPWSFHLPAEKTLEQVLVDSWQQEPESDTYRRTQNDTLRATLTSITVRQRLTRQFSPPFLSRLISRISPVAQAAVDTILVVLKDADINASVTALFERLLWETAFVQTTRSIGIAEPQLVRETWQHLPTQIISSNALVAKLERHWPDVIGEISVNERITVPDPKSSKEENTAPEQAIDLPRKMGTETEPDKQLDTKDGLYIDNAGLVLLHPFLPQFFGALGIADEHQLRQPDRALCLLHFLATGQSIAPEHALVLPKVLCNIPVETPVESDVALTEVEKEEAMALLEAVIRYWEALRSTSPDGLRGTFLVRPGKLSLHNDGDWLLQVELRAYDILLDQLPWGISMIKLPWMKQMLRVEWR